MPSGPDHSSSPDQAAQPPDFDQTTRQVEERSAGFGTGDRGDHEISPLCIGRYEIRAKLGRGGFGNVYRAWDPELNCDVAIKVPRADRILGAGERERFRNEARTLARIRNHPSIVTVYDVGETDDGIVFAVMEFVDGEPLGRHIADRELTQDQSLHILMKIAEALQVAHQATIVHRDLKPSNVILDKEKTGITLVDFGLALHDDLSLADLGTEIEGTPKYMAPEQIRGENHRIDGQTDIWAFGVIMYRMLTGKHPFGARDTRELARVIRYKDPKPLRQLEPDIPREIERICLKCLSKMMGDRYQSTPDLIDELSCAIDEMQALTDPAAALASHRLQALDRDTGYGRQILNDSRRSGPSGRSGVSAVSEPSQSQQLQITYKGLRPFDSNDRDFFLQLLPGPRTRDNIPESIQFWSSRIRGDELEPLAVGLIYGPSGCGKSSFVRAGLLPVLPAQINPIYLECSSENTERRLVQQIAHRIDSVDGNDSLQDILRQIRRGIHLDPNDKLLIVLDQFEQWLHGNNRYAEQELTEALRQCDGERIICLLLIRDDFWMSTSEFMKSLDIPVREGHNALALPLFDERHARNVLVAYGRSFDRLPISADEQKSSLNAQQSRFIRDAVKSLSRDGKVICVHLSVFAQIARDRDWTASELHRLGGLKGVGVRFLDDLFPSRSGSRFRNDQDEIVKSVFRGLLPGTSTVIKGTSKSRDQLWQGLGGRFTRQAFDQVLDRLESELRLISRVDSDGLHESTDQDDRETGQIFRLTHDFLVIPIREWLDRKQKETRKGRSLQRLTELGDAWNSTGDSCYLPGLFEYLSFVFSAPKHATAAYRDFLKVGGRRQSRRLGAIAVVFAFTAMAIGYLIHDGLNKSAKRHADNYLVASAENAPVYAKLLEDWKWRAKPLLVAGLDSQSNITRLRASSFLIGQFGDDPKFVETFVDALKTAPETEFRHTTTTITRLAPSTISEFVSWAGQIEERKRRVRFAMLFLNCGFSEIAEQVLNGRNSYERSYFIKTFPEFFWSPEIVSGALQSTSSEDFKGGLCLALANCREQSLASGSDPEPNVPFRVLQQWFDSPESPNGTRSAIEFVMRRFGNGPEYSERESRRQDGWKSIELADNCWVTFARIGGGTFDPMDGMTEEAISRYGVDRRKTLAPGETAVAPFYLCSIPVTRDLFYHFVRQLPDDHPLKTAEKMPPGASGADREFPATDIQWQHAVEFCNWLGRQYGMPAYYEKEPLSDDELASLQNAQIPDEMILREKWVVPDPQGPGFRLPFAAEWQFAYKAGTHTLTPFTDSRHEPFWELYSSFEQDTPSGSIFGTVFSKMPNQFGLFDMAGNTSQWCNDTYEDFFHMRCGGHSRSSESELLPGVFGYTAMSDSLGIESIRLAINPGADGFFPQTKSQK